MRARQVDDVGVGRWSRSWNMQARCAPGWNPAWAFAWVSKIVQRQAELGQRVKAGDVLAQLDPKDYQLAAEAARAQLAAATTQRDLAAADYKRYAALKTRISSAAPSWSGATPP